MLTPSYPSVLEAVVGRSRLATATSRRPSVIAPSVHSGARMHASAAVQFACAGGDQLRRGRRARGSTAARSGTPRPRCGCAVAHWTSRSAAGSSIPASATMTSASRSGGRYLIGKRDEPLAERRLELFQRAAVGRVVRADEHERVRRLDDLAGAVEVERAAVVGQRVQDRPVSRGGPRRPRRDSRWHRP